MAIRLPLALQLALLVMLSIFWVLWRMVGEPIVERAIVIAPAPPEPQVIEQPPPIENHWVKPIPPERLPRIVNPDPEVTVTVVVEPGVTAPPGPVICCDKAIVTELPKASTDRDPTPVVLLQPDYPVSAAQRGIQGWVVVEFSVTRGGAVRDARVVDAKPARIFDENTLKAVARWRFNPRVVDGQPAEAVGVQRRIVFNLDE